MDIKTLIEHHTNGAAEALAEDIKGRKVETTNMSVSIRQRVAQIRAQQEFDRVGLPRADWKKI